MESRSKHSAGVGAGGRRPPDGVQLWLSDANRGLFAVACPLGGSTRSATFVLDALSKWTEPDADNARATIEDPGCAALRSLILLAQQQWAEIVQSDGQLRGAGATVAVIALRERRASVAHLGDCRVYQLRNGRVLRQTRDHVQDAMHGARGEVNVLIRAFGMDSNPEIYSWEFREGDAFVLLSEVHSVLTDDEIVAEVVADCDPSECARRLVSLAGQRGATDWISALVVLLSYAAPG